MKMANETKANPITSATSNKARPEAQVWLNVGLTVGDNFESPFTGIPIDTAELKRFANNAKPELEAHRNLFAAIQAMAGQLQAGESKTIKLECQLYRREDKAEPVQDAAGIDAIIAALS